jgi:hypothetical protein
VLYDPKPRKLKPDVRLSTDSPVRPTHVSEYPAPVLTNIVVNSGVSSTST